MVDYWLRLVLRYLNEYAQFIDRREKGDLMV